MHTQLGTACSDVVAKQAAFDKFRTCAGTSLLQKKNSGTLDMSINDASVQNMPTQRSAFLIFLTQKNDSSEWSNFGPA
jgi:hypothetical protein